MNVTGLGAVVAPANLLAANPTPPVDSKGFGDVLAGAIEAVNTEQKVADGALVNLGSGKDVDLHGTMIALEKADISLRTMVSVRDKLVAAYEQVMNMTL